MNQLGMVLQREFLRVSRDSDAATPPSFDTLQAQAEFLDITYSWLSRIKNGKVNTTPELAQKMAAKFHPDSMDRRRLLADELLIASTTSADAAPMVESVHPGDVSEVAALFARLSRKGTFVAVDYRDYPRTAGAGARYPHYAEVAGEAVAAGMTFALFQPFGPTKFFERPAKTTKNSPYRHTKTVRRYLEDLHDRVREAHLTILSHALKAAAKAKGESLTKPEQLEIARRVMLYEKGETSSCPIGAGFSSRLFYVAIPNRDAEITEIWDWIATPVRDSFLQRAPESLPPDVVADQFFPIVHIWHKDRRLPLRNSEIKSAVNLYSHALDASLPEDFWTVACTPESALDQIPKNPLLPQILKNPALS